MGFSHLPSLLKDLPQWVNTWQGSKIPMQSTIRKGASTVDKSTWSDFETATKSIELGIYDNLGFVFNDNGFVGIDIDKPELVNEIMNKFNSYTERSISGRGIHIIVKGDIPFKGKSDNGVEIYKSGRYFIMTGDIVNGLNEIVENQGAIDWLVETYLKNEPIVKERTANNGVIYAPKFEKPNGKIKLTPEYTKIPKGMRNISLTSLAGQLHNQGYNAGDIYKELLKCNATACDPPIMQREVENIVKSVMRYKRGRG